jgi:hypothetical protein
VAEWRERISARAALCARMAPRGETKKHPRRAGTKLSRRVRQKWSRRDGSLTIDIRGVDPPLGVPPVSGYPARTSCTKEPRTPQQIALRGLRREMTESSHPYWLVEVATNPKEGDQPWNANSGLNCTVW